MKKTFVIAAFALLLGACAQQPYYGQQGYYQPSGYQAYRPNMFRNAAVGAVVGAGAGQLLGKDTESTVTGALLGGLLGSQINE